MSIEIMIPVILSSVISGYTLYTTRKSKSQSIVSEDKKTTLEERKVNFAHEESQIETLLREVADYRLEYKEARAERETWHEERLYLTQLILSLRTRIERLLLVLEKHEIDIPKDVLEDKL